jgi:hypothetical protein
MKAQTFIHRSVGRLPAATAFWLVVGMPSDTDVTVSGRTIG